MTTPEIHKALIIGYSAMQSLRELTGIVPMDDELETMRLLLKRIDDEAIEEEKTA